MQNFVSRRFCITVNNYDDTDIGKFRLFVSDARHKYCCYQRERGANGTDHLQGYVVFTGSQRRSYVASIWPRAHIEAARGKEDACIAYCSKADDTTIPGTFEEFGTRSSGQGKRTDIDGFVQAIKDGGHGRELFESHPEEFLRYNGASSIVRMYAERRSFKTEVYWLWGATGTGKSRWANWKFGEAYWKPPVNKWWDGYVPAAHGAIIIDDYRRDFCTFAELLRLFDRYPYSVECKNGTIEFSARVIVITSPYPPEETWTGQSEEHLGQLARRIEHVVYFAKGGEAQSDDEVYAGEESDAGTRSESESRARGEIARALEERAARGVGQYASGFRPYQRG